MPRFIYLRLHLLVLLFATTAILGAWITLSAPALVFWRTFLAAVVGALLLASAGLSRVRPMPGTMWPLLGIGAIIGMHWICFFGAIRLANVSICLAGMATISFFTAFTEPWLDRRRVRPFEVALGLLVFLGIVIVAGFERGRLAGLLVALLGAFLAAVFPVLNRRLVLRAGMEPSVMVVWEMAGAALVALLLMPLLDGAGAYSHMFDWHGLDWLWLLALALVCTVFAHRAHIQLLRHLTAYTGNLAMNFEPVYGIALAALIFGEHRDLHPGFFAGTATILAANVFHPLLARRSRRT